MKLRIDGNSVRLRLSQSEVRRLSAGETVEQRVGLSPQQLVYRLAPASGFSVKFKDGEMNIYLQTLSIAGWAMGPDVGIEAAIGTPDEPITLLIEKDFKCLHGESRANEDCFENPLAAADTGDPAS